MDWVQNPEIQVTAVLPGEHVDETSAPRSWQKKQADIPVATDVIRTAAEKAWHNEDSKVDGGNQSFGRTFLGLGHHSEKNALMLVSSSEVDGKNQWADTPADVPLREQPFDQVVRRVLDCRKSYVD